MSIDVVSKEIEPPGDRIRMAAPGDSGSRGECHGTEGGQSLRGLRAVRRLDPQDSGMRPHLGLLLSNKITKHSGYLGDERQLITARRPA